MEKWVFIRTFFILPFFLQKGKSEADEKSEMGKTLKPERGENDNKPASQEAWKVCKDLAIQELSNKKLYVMDR